MISLVRTAKNWGWSPTALIRNAKNPRKAHTMDYVVASAYQILDDEKCPKCGVQTWLAYSEDSSVTFKLDHIDCYSCAYKDEQEKDKKQDDNPGQTTYVIPIPEEGFDKLPDRAAFYKHLTAKHELEEKRRKVE